MRKLSILIFIVSISILNGCGKSDFLSGNAYQYLSEDGEEIFTVKFENDTMYYIAQLDTIKQHSTAYQLVHYDSTMYAVDIQVNPEWWGSEYVWIIVKTDYGFYSNGTLKKYYLFNGNFNELWK